MTAVFKREFKSYFSSPLGYIYIAIMYLYSAFLFGALLSGGSSKIEYVFNDMFIGSLIVVPLITMRLLSEDKKLKTDQLLLTSSVNVSGVVLGKYFAALVMYIIAIIPTLLYQIILAAFAKPNWQIFLGNFLALLLVGAAMIAIGLLISALTESQTIAAIMTLAAMVVVIFMDSIASALPAALAFLSKALTSISFMTRYTDFTGGILNVSHIIFFISITVAFVFITVRVIERKRWS